VTTTPAGLAAGASTSSTADPGTVVAVGKGPVGLAADADGSVWVAQAGASGVARIRSGKVDLEVKGIDVPLRVAAADGAVWATAFGTGELVRITAATGQVTQRVPVGKGAEGVTVGLGSVWVVAQDAGRLVRVDPSTSAVAGSADIGVGARLVTTGAGAVWVSHYVNGTVLRVDPATLAVTTSPRICGGPQGIVATAEAVWVACTTDNVVVRLDPTTWAVTARVPTPTAPDDLVAGPDGRLRLVAQQGPTLVVIDPKTNAVLSQRVLGTLPQLDDRANLAVAATADATWVSSFSADAVHRLTTG
jgi:streptogramin lyase